MSLRTRLILSILGVLILCSSLSTVYTQSQNEHITRDLMTQNAREAVSSAQRELANALSFVESELSTLSIMPILTSAVDSDGQKFLLDINREALQEIFVKFQKLVPQIDRVYLVDAAGVIVTSLDGKLVGDSRKGVGYFEKAMSGVSAVEGPLVSFSTGDPAYIMSFPVHADGAVVGVVFATVNLKDLNESIIAPVKIGSSGYVSVIAPDGRVLLHPQWDKVLKESMADQDWFQQVARKASGVVEYTTPQGECLSVYDTIPGLNWKVVGTVRTEDVFAPLYETRLVTIFASALSILLVAGVLSLLVGRVLGVVSKCARFADAITHGDFSATLTVRRNDELGGLCDSLRAALVNIKEQIGFSQGLFTSLTIPCAICDADDRITFLNQPMAELVGLDCKGEGCVGLTSGEVLLGNAQASTVFTEILQTKAGYSGRARTIRNRAGTMVHVLENGAPLFDLDGKLIGAVVLRLDVSSEARHREHMASLNTRMIETAASARGIVEEQTAQYKNFTKLFKETESFAREQDSAARQSGAAMEGMNANLHRMAEASEETSHNARAMRDEAVQGEGVVREVMDNIREATRAAEQLGEDMRRLGERAQGINGVIVLINDIADQTNLLALNAAIEAARAGEAGRGFAVVADEVRKLAEKTLSATSEVNATVRAIQAGVGDSMTVADRVRALSLASSESAERSGESLSGIVKLAGDSAQAIQLVAQLAEEQVGHCEAVLQSIQTISGYSRQTVEQMQGTGEEIQRLSGLSEELVRLIETIKR